ncbi:MAG TPA: SusD/RagB family nutrient-binding outer membrane lipoprotein [Saprospiraceae bacterium]|nr:SusD/RagB family nutrient-binding outer membrane lipoprotein [Saprospiraceae bacterium]HPN70284.1 SusD/RagB family nutrient-binding outer membrane lipoprotein [Saprospiraceae bacterium]
MKNTKIYIIAIALLTVLGSCDKDFVEINTNPYALTNIDPGLLFAGSQRTSLGGWESEHTIAQHFVNPHNSGATQGPNFNTDNDNFNNGVWDGSYPNVIKNLTQALFLLETQPERVNLRSMIRIWKAQTFMNVVDSYGDVPYFNAGQAFIKGDEFFYPAYDDDAAIYADLEKELKESVAALSATADFVAPDLFYGAKGSIPSTTAAVQTDKWKKLGNSLLLRLGMRYAKADPSKAAAITAAAFSGGVMTSNADNAYVKFDGAAFTNGRNGGLVNNNPYFYYAAEPFVNHLKNTEDPRTKFIIATYKNPADPLADTAPNVVTAEQFGVPIGILNTELSKPAYRGVRGGGYNYSQMNVNSLASLTAPNFFVTYSEVALMLAEAAQRGWIAGGAAAAKQYYEDGIRADIGRYSLYPKTSTIPESDIVAFLAHPNVAYNAAKGIELINNQLWVAYISNGIQAFANFRRSGFPTLSPNKANDLYGGGFARRFSYPDYELAQNNANYLAAAAAIGGDKMTSRVFWDK